MTSMDRETLIAGLRDSFAYDLPDVVDEKRSFFDEGTGTLYSIIGQPKMDKLNVERAKNYFENVLTKLKTARPGSNDFQKAIYCAIAIEAIDKYLMKKKR